MMTYPVLSLVAVFGETLTFIVDVPAVPDEGDTSIQLLDVEAVQFASELTVTLTLPAVLLKTNVSVEALTEAGACLTVNFFDVFIVPS